MKVYVSEMPKSCIKCPCMNEDYERGRWCNIETSLDIQTDYDKETFTSKLHRQRHEGCPLQSLADYTKQVRKEVVSELMNMLGDRAELIDCGGVAEFMFTTYDLTMCVKEILGEEKGETECQKN